MYDFDSKEATQFQGAIERLIENEKEIKVEALDFIHAINCSLTLRLSSHEKGLHGLTGNVFECTLTKESYQEMIQFIQPFVDQESDGYQWLPNGNTDTDFLFSPGGTW